MLCRDEKDERSPELHKAQARHNYYTFLTLTIVLFLSSLLFMTLQVVLEWDYDAQWLTSAYVQTYIAAMVLSVVFAVWLWLAWRRQSLQQVTVAAVLFSMVIIAIGLTLTTLDYYTNESLVSVFIAVFGVFILLSARWWVYVLLEAWLVFLFVMLYLLILQDLTNSYIIFSMLFLVLLSLSLGLYSQDSRARMQLLSIQLEAANQELKHLMFRDPLTGAYNRLFLNEYIQQQLNLIRRYREPISILMLDLDHFKEINDSLGHQFGDSVLVEVVRKMTGRLRDSDFLARIGGEEFLVVLPKTSLQNAAEVAEEIRRIVAGMKLDGLPWQLTVSIGVGEIGRLEGYDQAVHRVDAALYRAKMKGRNAVDVSA